MEQAVVGVTLWDLLREPAVCLHLPRYALFLLIAIPLEIYADRRRVCPSCAIATVFLQLTTGLGGIATIYLLMSGSFEVADRILVPAWYYPLMVVLVGVPAGFFMVGICRLFLMGKTRNALVRCMIFLGTLYFAASVIMTPVRVNRMIESSDSEPLHAESVS